MYQIPSLKEFHPISSEKLKEVHDSQTFSLWEQLKVIQLPKLKKNGIHQSDTGLQMYGIPHIWSDTKGEGVKIAVLDTGIDTNHPAFKGAILNTQDFTGEGIEDRNGHGTHCAGIIAARLAEQRFEGLAPKAKLLIGKVLDREGRGEVASIASGINWAVQNQVDIISISFGGLSSDNLLHRAIHYALAEGVFVICSAGNYGSRYRSNIGYPGRYGGVITVAAHDEFGNPISSSSRGGELDFIAPGDNIFSTYKDGSYAILSGTSMAAPWVAGLAALIQAKHKQSDYNHTPLENNEDLRKHLLRMASHPGNHENGSGYGTLIAFESMTYDLIEEFEVNSVTRRQCRIKDGQVKKRNGRLFCDGGNYDGVSVRG